MIIDNIRNKARYLALHPELAEVFTFLETLTSESEAKRYELSENAYVNHMVYTTKPEAECRFEVHAVYADIQYMVDGCEVIDLADDQGLTVNENRLESGDVCFYDAPATYTRVTLRDGDFVLIYPHEAHRPSIAVSDSPISVCKAVAKLRF
jgi:YhcH/YjgK/YiaL family protein